MTLVVSLDGVAPGVGKSTLAEALARSYVDAGLNVQLFREEEVLTHSTCTALATEFRRSGRCDIQTLLDTAAAYLDWLDERSPDVAVLDAFLPFISSLMAWGHGSEDVEAFVSRLAHVLGRPGMTFVFTYLDGDPVVSLGRAVEREGEAWLEWLIGSLHDAQPGPVRRLDELTTFLLARRTLTLTALDEAGLNVVRVPGADARPRAELLRDALELLAAVRAC